MKVKIGNHKSCLYQWDTGQFVVIDGAEQCNEIHFCNDRSKNALVVKIADQDGKRIANIPNILLQNDGSIYAYLFARNEDGSETRTSASFPVRGRKKPESYVYTETERWTYDNIERRLDDLEDSMTHGTVKSINGLIPDANGNVEIEIPEGITGSGIIASDTAPEDTSVLWVDTDEDEVDNVQDVINEALAQAKASGEFKGEPGYTPVKGVDYFDGDDYTLTDADKTEIAELAAEMVDVPEDGDSALYLVDAQNPNFEEAYAAYEAGKILQMTNLPSNDSYTVNQNNRIDFYTYIQGATFGNVTLPSHLDFFGLVYSNTTGGYIEAVAGLDSNNACSIAYQPLRGYLTEHQDISGKLDASELPQAINTALEQAKASGEFKGDPGDDYVLTDADKQEIAELTAPLVDVPEGGSNQPLTFTGAVNATYDGSKAVSVEIPQGGGSTEWRKVAEIKTTEDLNYLSVTEDMDGNPFAFDEMLVLVGAARASDATTTGHFVISPCSEWFTSFNGHGIYSFNLNADVYAYSVMFKSLTDGLLKIENSAGKRIAGSLSQYTGYASDVEKFNAQVTAAFEASGLLITPSGSASRSYLDENGKLRSVTIGTDLATSIKIGAGSTLEVWGR